MVCAIVRASSDKSTPTASRLLDFEMHYQRCMFLLSHCGHISLAVCRMALCFASPGDWLSQFWPVPQNYDKSPPTKIFACGALGTEATSPQDW